LKFGKKEKKNVFNENPTYWRATTRVIGTNILEPSQQQ
jgi:hypothetical protein